MKKRFLALALTLVMVFVLAACGEGECADMLALAGEVTPHA